MKLEEVNTRTKEAVDFLVAALESGHSEVLTAYLGAMAKFHTYSFGNIMLIARQKPDATNVAGLRTWNSLGRFVKRGEKGVFILAPMVGRRSTKGVATDEPSEDATTEGQRTLYGFRAVYVFDRLSRDLWPSRGAGQENFSSGKHEPGPGRITCGGGFRQGDIVGGNAVGGEIRVHVLIAVERTRCAAEMSRNDNQRHNGCSDQSEVPSIYLVHGFLA